jgi:hypothetical protein
MRYVLLALLGPDKTGSRCLYLAGKGDPKLRFRTSLFDPQRTSQRRV